MLVIENFFGVHRNRDPTVYEIKDETWGCLFLQSATTSNSYSMTVETEKLIFYSPVQRLCLLSILRNLIGGPGTTHSKIRVASYRIPSLFLRQAMLQGDEVIVALHSANAERKAHALMPVVDNVSS